MSDLSPEAVAWIANEARAISRFADLNWDEIHDQKKRLCYELAKMKYLHNQLEAKLEEERHKR